MVTITVTKFGESQNPSPNLVKKIALFYSQYTLVFLPRSGMGNLMWDLGWGTGLKRRISTFRLGGRGIQMKTINSINSLISIPSLEYERRSQI